MKNNEANIFVLIASIIVGIMISLNMSFSNKGTITILDTKQYEEAANNKTRLRNQISIMKAQYNLSYDKLSKYEDVGLNNAKVAQEMQNELLKNIISFGTTDVHGQGIKITLDDASEELRIDDPYHIHMVHNYDIASVINELKLAGAEAISVNGERVTDWSSIFCDWIYVQSNGTQVYPPFNIEVIGNKDLLYEFMNRKSGYLKRMSILRKLSVDIGEVDEVKINGFRKDIKSKFLTIVGK